MRLLEYEAKSILKSHGMPVAPHNILTKNAPQPATHFPSVVKSQVLVGGRGKAGGVVVVENTQDMIDAIDTLFALPIKDHLPQVLLAEEKISIDKEHYLSVLINRETASIQLVAHPEGGIEVESQTDFYRRDITPESIETIAGEVAQLYKDEDTSALARLIQATYDCFVAEDATLLEINPLVKTTNAAYVCVDAKMELDDAASYRHKEWNFEDKTPDVNFVTLDETGEIATIANGAGLAMATVDAVAAYDMRPANFLDVGGGANKESVLRAFTRIMQYPSIRAIVINIFAGITRCDEVARAIIAAKEEIEGLPPLFIRLAGTNYEEATVLLRDANIPILPTLEACLEAAKEATGE